MGVQSQKFQADAARGPRLGLTQDKAERKRQPIASGVLDYFPAALAAVAQVSVIGNEQHNAGQPLHWARGKSQDHADCISRHLIERGSRDDDGALHSAKLAWRALALLQTELEEAAANIITASEIVERQQRWDRPEEQVWPSPLPVPDHELPQTRMQFDRGAIREIVLVGRRAVPMATPEEALKRIQEMDSTVGGHPEENR